MSLLEDCGHRDDRRQGARHPDLHAQEAEPAAGGEALPWVRRVGQRQLAVDGDRVMQRRQQRPAVVDHSQHARAEALVVVDHVEVAVPMRPAACAPAWRMPAARRSPARAHDAELHPILTAREFPRMRHAERIGVPVEVEAGHRGEAHPRVELGPGRPGEHLDRVAQRDQFPGQMPGVDALAPAAGIATVDEEGDPQTPRSRGCRGHAGGYLDVAGALPGLLGLDPLLSGRFRHKVFRHIQPWPHSLPEPPAPTQTSRHIRASAIVN